MPDELAATAQSQLTQELQELLPEMDSPNQLLTVDQFCAWAHISKRTFRDWCQSGVAPRRIKIAGSVRVRVGDALDWLESRYVID